MICAFAEFWPIFLIIGVISFCVLILLPSDATKTALISGAICALCVALLGIAAGAKNDLRCKEMTYLSVLDRRPELVRECPTREGPGCQIKWIRYQQDSLSRYLQILR